MGIIKTGQTMLIDEKLFKSAIAQGQLRSLGTDRNESCEILGRKGTFSTEERKLAQWEEGVRPIHEYDEDVSKMVMQVLSNCM